MKKFFITMLFATLLFTKTHAMSSEAVSFVFPSSSFQETPAVINNQTYFSLVNLADAMKAQMTWDTEFNVIHFKTEKSDTIFVLDSGDSASPNIFMQNDKAMVSVQYASSVLKLYARFDETKKTYIFSETKPQNPNSGANPANSDKPTSSFGSLLIKTADKYIGTPYKYGGDYNRDKKFDCSSFVQRVFEDMGYFLPRVADDQSKTGAAVPLSKARTGDLVFFDYENDGVANHVGIIVDQNTFVHASSSKGVIYSKISGYWGKYILTVKRVVG